ncbi:MULTISPECIES: methyltransferase domain-containing protein [Cysteiniphilum]|uniref:methyltransferase domain-containing protein n=1 Tax=Cysteiniphilum TaxID=2056696 RepID=UPI00177E5D9C|nr:MULTISPECIES: methyltransferase domain-containing protein [Cysteiniphilum]
MLKSPRISFSAAKDSYHQHDQVQRKVDENLKNMVFQYLEQTRNTQHILELGCGDGVSSIDIVKKIMPLTYDAVDIADVLIDKAKEIAVDSSSISRCNFNFIQGDFNQSFFWQTLPQKKYDVIYSNMALQWSYCLQRLFKYIDQVLTVNGMFAFSIPLDGTFEELKKIVRINKFTMHHEMQSLFKSFNWQCLSIDKQSIQLEFVNRMAQLKHLKSTGVNSYLGDEKSEKGEKPEVKSLWRYLRDDNEQMTTLSYEVGLYVITKG